MICTRAAANPREVPVLDKTANTNSKNIDERMLEMGEDEIKKIVGRYVDIESGRRMGDNVLARCPFHDDSTPSFSIAVAGRKKGLWHCFGCGEKGNLYSLVKRLGNKSNAETLKELGVESAPPVRGELRLEEFLASKKLSRETAERWGLYEGRANAGDGTELRCVVMPYHKIGTSEELYRKRRFSGSPKFDLVGKNGPAVPYAPKDFPQIPTGILFLCEGESDALALSEAGYQSLGIGGANGVGSAWKSMPDLSRLDEIRVCVDDDEAGLVFATEILQRLAGPDSTFKGGVALAFGSDFADEGDGCKDVCDLWTRYGGAVVESLASGKTRPVKEALEELSKLRSETPPDYGYAIPTDYSVSAKGVVKREENAKGEISEKTVLSYPLLWAGLTKDETGLSTELLARFGGKWRSYRFPRCSVARASELVNVTSSAGLPGITDANARETMKYLAAAEAANINVPVVERVSGTRWLGASHYAPFVLPEHTVADASEFACSDAPGKSGAGWFDAYARLVQPSIGARCVVASAVGSTLLDVTGCRSHVVYTWGASQGGKTAALTAAAAFFGKPENIMGSMYGTVVGIELAAAKRHDMALILDERQVVARNAGRGQDTVEQIVYMLAGGRGKLRGAKEGGLRDVQSWRTVALVSGEEAISKSDSQAGVHSRTLPLYGRPFRTTEDAKRCYDEFPKRYGAFKRWIEYVVEERESVRIAYDGFLKDVDRMARESGCDTTSSHIQYIANMAVADMFLTELAFVLDGRRPDRNAARAAAYDTIRHALRNFENHDEVSYSRRALSALCGYAVTNAHNFRPSPGGKRYGDLDLASGTLFITGDGLKAFCAESKFDVERLKRDWAAEGVFRKYAGGFTNPRVLEGVGRVRCYAVVLPPEELSAGAGDGDSAGMAF